jgi:hypothetical protein
VLSRSAGDATVNLTVRHAHRERRTESG